MNRITTVELDGFKGQSRTIELGVRTVLSGPNGLGKSAVLEAVRYALSGEVPSGKTNDAVAEFFPHRGGTVTVTDAAGNFIRRGIERDHDSPKVSEVLQEEGDARWIANDALLDMQGFLALSANKRREFVLRLVGAGETPTDSEIHAVLARDYARQIGGPGADPSILTDRIDDLPADIRLLAERWLAIWGVLNSYLRTGPNTASAIFQRLVDEAKVRKNSSRRLAIDAKSASRELKAAAKGAGAAAADVEKRREGVKSAAEIFSAAREEKARREEASESLVVVARDRADLASRIGKLTSPLEPGERPNVDASPSADAARLTADAKTLQERADEVLAERRDLESASEYLKASRGVLEQAKGELETLYAEPIARALKLADQILSQLGPARRQDAGLGALCGLVDNLVEVVDELAESWKTRQEKTSVRLAECALGVRDAEEKYAGLSTLPDNEDYMADLGLQIAKTVDSAVVLQNQNDERIEAEQEALKEWETKTNRATEARTEVKGLKERYDAARDRHAEIEEKLAAMPDPPVRALEEDVVAAREELQEAEEAAGAVNTYEEAVARAARERVAEKSWAAVETACKRARENYVADIVKPLKADIATVLACAGRKEQVYLALENDRAKAIFELGWTVGDTRRSLSALSGGEAVLFTTALALTIARRSKGRRVLMIEADPLDEANLGQLLRALSGIEELDACLVATSTGVSAAETWSCIQFKHPEGYRPAEPVQREPTGEAIAYNLFAERMMDKSRPYPGVEIATPPGETPTETAQRILGSK